MFKIKNQMIAFLVLLISLASANSAHAAFFPSGTTAGNQFFNQPVTSGMVKGLTATCTGSNYDTFKTPDGVAYQVPVSKKAIILSLKGTSGTAAGYYTIGYGTASVSNSTAPAGSKPAALYAFSTETSGQANAQPISIYYETPASSYPYILCGGSASYIIATVIETAAP